MNILFDEKTKDALKAYVESKDNKVIRLEVLRVGCGKPSLGISLDVQHTDDLAENFQGIPFVVNQKSFLCSENIEIKYNPEVYVSDFYVHTV